jgi:hypothetical protein
MVTTASEALGIAALPFRALVTMAPPALVRDAPENAEHYFRSVPFFCLKVHILSVSIYPHIFKLFIFIWVGTFSKKMCCMCTIKKNKKKLGY